MERKRWKRGREENEARETNGEREICTGQMDQRRNKYCWMEIQYHYDTAISTARTPEAHPPPPEGDKPANGTRNERRINHLASTYRDFIAHQTSIHITPGLVLAL